MITVARAIEIGTWTPDAMLEELMRLAVGKRTVVEIGSWLGRSTIALARTAERVYAIDHWQGDGYIGQVENPIALYAQFLWNLQSAGVATRVIPLFAYSVAAAYLWKDREIDLLFLDGDHSAIAVREDLEQWVPHVAANGLVCGDDWNIVQEPVKKFFGKRQDAGEAWRFETRCNNRLWVAWRSDAVNL